MLTVNELSVRLPDRTLLDSVSFIVNNNDCAALIGPNGAGKSTLLSVIAGLQKPDSGSVSIPPGATMRYLRQGIADRPNGLLRDLLDDQLEGVLAAQAEMDLLAIAIASDPGDSAIAAWEAVSGRFEELGGYVRVAALEASMHAFGVGEIDLDRPLASLSGGEKTRASMAAVIAIDPDILLLDEPSNHLDREGIDWLESFLRSRTGATLVVSHDRALLDAVATKLLEIDPETGRVREFRGGYSDFVQVRQHEASEHEAAYHRQQELIGRIEGDIRQVAGKASTYEAMSVNDYQRGRSRRIARTAVVRKRKLERLLDSDERIERPERTWGMAVSFGEAPASGNRLIHIDDGSITIDGSPLLAGIELTVNAGERIGLVGANGSGKTTLLSVLAGHRTLDSGSYERSPSVKPGWFTQEHDGVDLDRTPLDQARSRTVGTEGEVRAFLHQFLLGPSQVLQPAGALSYGERARLALALLAIGGANLLLLDEPMNHLDIPSREQLEEAINTANVAVVMVSHDRYALERIGARIVDVERWRAHQ